MLRTRWTWREIGETPRYVLDAVMERLIEEQGEADEALDT
jgi:hypothetical protein